MLQKMKCAFSCLVIGFTFIGPMLYCFNSERAWSFFNINTIASGVKYGNQPHNIGGS